MTVLRSLGLRWLLVLWCSSQGNATDQPVSTLKDAYIIGPGDVLDLKLFDAEEPGTRGVERWQVSPLVGSAAERFDVAAGDFGAAADEQESRPTCSCGW